VPVNAWSGATIPGLGACLADDAPTSGPKTGAGFAGECVGDEAAVAQGPSGTPSGGVQFAGGMRSAIGATTGDFKSPPIVGKAGYRTAAHGNTDDLAVIVDGDGEPEGPAVGFAVMPVMALDKPHGLAVGDGLELESHAAASASSRSASAFQSISDGATGQLPTLIMFARAFCMWGRRKPFPPCS
jgi:hypothetical protein